MRKNLMSPKTWIIVADSARLRLFLHQADGFTEIAHDVSADSLLPSSALASDRPGRSYESANPARHAIEPSSDPHEAAALRFLHRVADEIEQGRVRGDFDRLVLAAPPRALGVLRQALTAPARRLVVLEVDKDLLGLTETDLQRRLVDLAAVPVA